MDGGEWRGVGKEVVVEKGKVLMGKGGTGEWGWGGQPALPI